MTVQEARDQCRGGPIYRTHLSQVPELHILLSNDKMICVERKKLTCSYLSYELARKLRDLSDWEPLQETN